MAPWPARHGSLALPGRATAALCIVHGREGANASGWKKGLIEKPVWVHGRDAHRVKCAASVTDCVKTTIELEPGSNKTSELRCLYS